MNKFVTILMLWMLALVVPYSLGQWSVDLGIFVPAGLLVSLVVGYIWIGIFWVSLQPGSGWFTAPKVFWFALAVHFIAWSFASFPSEFLPGGTLGIVIGHQLCKWSWYFYHNQHEQSVGL